MPSKKKKYNARFPPVSTWPGWAPAGRAPGRLGPRSCWWGGRVPLGVHGLTPRPFHALLT